MRINQTQVKTLPQQRWERYTRFLPGLLAAALLIRSALLVSAAEPIIPSRARVAVVGDSITQQQLYSRYLEMYLTVCEPQLEAEVFQFGWGGERASGFLARMDESLKYFKPNVVTLCYGMNDGQYRPYDSTIGEDYRKPMATIVSKLKAAGVECVVGGPGAVDTTFYTRAGATSEVYNQNLRQLSRIAAGIAFSNQLPHAEVHALMMDVMARAKDAYGSNYDVCGRDGVHPNPNGHLIMAQAFLKSMRFDGDLGRIVLDFNGPSSAVGGHVLKSFLQGKAEIESHRYPFCFPFPTNTPTCVSSILPFLTFCDDLNRLTLVVKHAPSGRMKVTWGGHSKVFDKSELEHGVNLAEEYIPNPFNPAFEKVEAAVSAKEAYETDMIKVLSQGLGTWRSDFKGNTEVISAIDLLEKSLRERWNALDAEVKSSFTPVTHTISLESATECVEKPLILTPPASHTPRINGAGVFGVRPGSPFLYTIPATGDRPMKFAARHLPNGLKLDSQTGRITGRLKSKGEFTVTLVAQNALGRAEKPFRIVCGELLALTPPMGWSSWNCFGEEVSEASVRAAAEALVSSGLINHGWTYVNIDDFWENNRDAKNPTLQGAFRDTNGVIVPNARFPDIQGLANHVHGLGLKIGLYSSPGPWTCGACAGSWEHEQQDAETYAAWGFDYLKYDWCRYYTPIASEALAGAVNLPGWVANHRNAYWVYPYYVMGKFLREQPRDIVFSLCEYGYGNVWEWGAAVNGSCWRTTKDITDTWRSVSKIGFNQAGHEHYAGPGHWNDPDMLVVGKLGWGKLRPTRLTPDEQYAHISLWCLLSAPLLIGCDLTQMDDFTLNLLTNDEVLAIDQDELGQQATCVITNGDLRVYARPLADGGEAVGFFNLGEEAVKLDFADFAKLHLSGRLSVRDLWRQQDVATIETASNSLPLSVARHGVVLFKFTKTK